MTFRNLPLSIIAFRVVLASMAAGAVAIAFTVSYRTAPQASNDKQRGAYSCPMHPEVIAASKSDCPICRMALEPLKPDRKAAVDSAAGVRTAAFSIPAAPEFRAFDAVSRTKIFPISLEMRATASAESDELGTAIVFRDEAELLKPDEVGLFLPNGRVPDGDPHGIEVRATGEPPVRWDSRTALVRFRAKPGELRPGEVGSLKFATRIRRGLVVRASAIIDSPEGPQVLVMSKDRRTLMRRRVEIGNVLYGYAAIVSGLAENETVASHHAFLLDVERRAIEEARL